MKNRLSRPTMVSTPEMVGSVYVLIFSEKIKQLRNFCGYSIQNDA